MKIAIGPIEGHYGGAAQNILNIVKHSRNKFDKIEVSYSLKEWGKFFRRYILPIQRKLPHSLEHSDKRFDMYGLQKRIDLPGLYTGLKLNNYSVVHLQGYPYWENVYSPKNKNLIYTVDNLYNYNDFPDNWRKTIDYLTDKMVKVCKKSSKVISIAKWLQNDLKRRFGVNSEYIPNGVDLDEIDSANGNEFRKKFGIEDDFYLFVGRATKYKRPELFAALAERLRDRKFVMIGRGITPQEFPKYLGRNIPSNLICLGEPERKDVLDAFHASRVFILPSANETFGIVLLEGMAFKKPIIGSNNLGPAEIINHKKNGLLFEPENLESLITQAKLAWNASELGLAGRQEIEKEYNWKNIIKKIDQIYEDTAYIKTKA